MDDIENKIAYLDIETQYTMNDFPGGWKNKDNYKNIKIAELGILRDGKYETFEEYNIEKLTSIIEDIDLIIGHNIVQFDCEVLKHYINKNTMNKLKSKIFDTMMEFQKFTGKAGWVSLDNIAQRNFGMKKTEDSVKIPEMWREGRIDEVKHYLLNDLKMTEQFYLHGKKGHTFKYEHKEYGKSFGEREVYIKW